MCSPSQFLGEAQSPSAIVRALEKSGRTLKARSGVFVFPFVVYTISRFMLKAHLGSFIGLLGKL